MRLDITSAIVLKLIGFSGIVLEIDSVMGTGDIFKYLDSFGVLAFLVVGIRYFMSELKRQDKAFVKQWDEREKIHSNEKIAILELANKNEEVSDLKIENLSKEILNLRVELAKNTVNRKGAN
jgi:uncharacterized protein YdcH (DUF465 family)